jgi:hypothetical protein
MCKALGSIPSTANIKNKTKTKTKLLSATSKNPSKNQKA